MSGNGHLIRLVTRQSLVKRSLNQTSRRIKGMIKYHTILGYGVYLTPYEEVETKTGVLT